jgi:hypothetical protein
MPKADEQPFQIIFPGLFDFTPLDENMVDSNLFAGGQGVY